ncbi:MAG TPA: hypothetical protein VFP23_01580 [Solirubrobacterales bacterium]|nr:hypothetical protein [Solirubrobacterales bacterium]
MPAATTIGRKQRDALYQLVRDHLSGLNDVWIAMERDKDFATARRLGLEFGSDLRLLEDLGWGEEDDRETVVLTMLPSELERILNRLRDEAEEGFFGSPAERTSRAADEETDRRLLLAMNSCEELLGALDRHAERRSS